MLRCIECGTPCVCPAEDGRCARCADLAALPGIIAAADRVIAAASPPERAERAEAPVRFVPAPSPSNLGTRPAAALLLAAFVAAVQAERERAAELHGGGPFLSLEVGVAVLTEEVGEVAQAVNDLRGLPAADRQQLRENLREECVQVAAMAMRLWESIR